MFSEEFEVAVGLKTQDELWRYASQLTRRLEFRTFTVMAVFDRLGKEPIFRVVDNISDAGAIALQANPEKGRQDPVMQHCKASHVPLAWSRHTYLQAGRPAHWEEQASYGFFAGIAAAMHLPNGRHLMIGLDLDKNLPQEGARVALCLAQLQLFLACAADATFELFQESENRNQFQLTARELEVMRWTMEGKTAWEVGHILGISEQTAARHLNNATQRMGCTNKLHAVVTAIRHRLIS